MDPYYRGHNTGHSAEQRPGEEYSSSNMNGYPSTSYVPAPQDYNLALGGVSRRPDGSYSHSGGHYPSPNQSYAQPTGTNGLSHHRSSYPTVPDHAPPAPMGRSSHEYHSSHPSSPPPQSPTHPSHGYSHHHAASSSYAPHSPAYAPYPQPYGQSHYGQESMMVHSPTYDMSMSSSPPFSSEYAMSLPRAFGCDMCSLSFHRQHDLKRHEKTHSGSKPYTCNGGCGKTFTRKDALKRHQLVKKCGTFDDNMI